MAVLTKHLPPCSKHVTEDDIDISQVYVVRKNNAPKSAQDVELMICWMNEKEMLFNGKYSVKHTTKTFVIIKDIKYK